MWSPKPLWTSLRIIEHLLTGAAIAFGTAIGRRMGLPLEWVPDVVRWWHARLCRVLGMRIKVTGEIAPNALLVGNHVSWLDIPVIGAQARILFLTKAEVGNWPLIGWMARIAGTLFITRGANETGVLVRRIGKHARNGEPVAIFPEGTTTDGSEVRRFHPRLLAAGQLDGVLVQPVALRYGTNAALDPIAPFVGDDSLLPHLARLVRHPHLRARLHFLPPVDGSALSRRQISERCRSAIADALGVETSAVRPFQAYPEGVEPLLSPSATLVETA